MTAKIRELFSRLVPALEQPKPIEVARPRTGGGLAAQLDTVLAAQWTGLLERYFAQMPQALAQRADQCQNPAEQRRCYDALRLAHMERARLIRSFTHEIARRLQPELDVAAPSPATPPPYPQVLEEVLLLAEVEAQIESRHSALVEDWSRRIAWMRRHMHLAVSPEALVPGGIVAALRAALERTDAAPEQRVLLYQAFADIVVPSLDAVLREAVQFLRSHGVGEPGWQDAAPLATPPVAPAIELDAVSLKRLHELAATPAADQYDDGALARTLLEQLAHDGAVRPRLALTARLIDRLVEDPLMPSVVRPVLEDLRWPVFKVALADASFLRNPAHPVRALLNEVAVMAAAARVTPRRSARQVVQLVCEVLVQFNLRASFVRDAMRDAQPPTADEAQQFAAQQDAAAALRRQHAQQMARRSADQAVELRTLGRPVPRTAQPFLITGWGPLLTRRLLRHGYDSDAWNGAIARLEQMLDALDARDPADAAAARAYDELLGAVAADLRAEGVAESRVAPLLDGLRAAYAAPLPGCAPLPASGAAAPAPERELPQGAVQDALARLLQPGQWFRVLDPDGSQARWLKLAAYYPRLDSVSFAGFDGDGALRMSASGFAQDLAARRAEPIGPSPEMRSALEALTQAVKA